MPYAEYQKGIRGFSNWGLIFIQKDNISLFLFFLFFLFFKIQSISSECTLCVEHEISPQAEQCGTKGQKKTCCNQKNSSRLQIHNWI